MIRRYYILPLKPFAPEAKVRELIEVLSAADRFIPGLLESSAGLDFDTRTVVWENGFVDEASYSGPYMVHPYHIGAIDNYVMADSPECVTQDIYVMRYQTADATQRVRRGIRRIVMMNAASDADAAAVAALAENGNGMAASAFGADNVGWVSAKGRAWTHIWEQAFTDEDQLEAYLQTREGVACSSLEGFTRLGIDLGALKIFTCPFELTPLDRQTPPPAPADDTPVVYTITARTSLDDAEEYIALLERLHDPFMATCGSGLTYRRHTIAQGYLECEIESAWSLASLAAYSEVRAKTYADPLWNEYVRDAMPLVRGGTRRFHREL